VIERPTQDVDLFTTSQDVTAFSAADQVTAQLRGSGYRVEQTRRAAQFARLRVDSADGLQLDLDLGVDWRQDDPVTLEVGPVLSLSDAVGNKVSALYSRGEPRDYLDVDAIRASGRFSDDQLIAAAAERDAGFEVESSPSSSPTSTGSLWPMSTGTTSPRTSWRSSRSGAHSGPLTFATSSPPTSPGAALTTDELRGLAERMRAYPS
jgi:Nucleotidyl transferase AbiEii toxin, Type IV TA system